MGENRYAYERATGAMLVAMELFGILIVCCAHKSTHAIKFHETKHTGVHTPTHTSKVIRNLNQI